MGFPLPKNKCSPEDIFNLLNRSEGSKILMVGGKTIEKWILSTLSTMTFAPNTGTKEVWLADERMTKDTSLRNETSLRRILPPRFILQDFYSPQSSVISSNLFDEWDSNFLTLEMVDLAIFAMGRDGHIASLLDVAATKVGKNIQILKIPTEPFWRVSVTLDYVDRVKEKVLLVQNNRLDKFRELYESNSYYGLVLQKFSKSEILNVL